MPDGRALARKSKVASKFKLPSAGNTKRRSLSRFSATAFTCAVRSNSRRRASGTTPPGTASAASAASCAAVSRSLSQVMRKLATEGTKIRTSASITNRMVSRRSLADKPKPRRRAHVPCKGEADDFTICQNLPGQAIASPSESRGTLYVTPRLLPGHQSPKSRKPADEFAYEWVRRSADIVSIGDAFVDLTKRRVG